jgi:HD-like signal output (HDOD) protein
VFYNLIIRIFLSNDIFFNDAFLSQSGIIVNNTILNLPNTDSKRKLTEQLIQTAREIKMLPDVAAKAIAIADDPNASTQAFANIIAQDPRLTRDILSLSNSPLFPRAPGVKPISCLKMAINRLGSRQTKQMILVSCYSSMLNQMDLEEVHVREILARHSFLTGVISTKLNKLFKLGIQGEEFTAGLLHDVGRILLATAAPKEFKLLDAMDFTERHDVINEEIEFIGTSHAEVGEWFLLRNHLPEELVSVARHHHNPAASGKFKRFVALISVADDLANYYQRQELEKEYDCTNLASLRLLETLGVENSIARLGEAWPKILSESVESSSQLFRL